MQANSVKEEVKINIAPIVSKAGYVLVDVEYKKMPNGMNLTLFIDGPNGMDLDGLEKVHRLVDVALDELDPTHGAPYTLNCSSLGLDRPISTEYEFNKYKNKEVEIKFYEPLKPINKKVIEAELVSWSEDELIVKFNGEEMPLSKKSIAQIVPIIKF